MRMNELVEVYDTTRRTAAATATWRLRRWARRVRRTIERDRSNQIEQVRLVAIESELIERGVQANRTIPLH
jgi:hypothetical protein